MKITCLAGGVGGSRLAHGFAQSDSGQLTVVVNTADDFQLHGLTICPDIDTVLYTLGGHSDPVRGWGLNKDTSLVMEALSRLGGETWFRLGDRDLATHLFRSHLLAQGESLESVTRKLTHAYGVEAQVLPMCEQPVRTKVRVDSGWLDFQDYFVGRGHRDAVRELFFEGQEQASLLESARAALNESQLIVLCPSNPFVSLAPILGLGSTRQLLREHPSVWAVSPILGGKAVKGPAGSMLASLGHEVSSLGVARLYQDFLDGFVIDHQDAELAPAIEALGLSCLTTATLMVDDQDRRRLAEAVRAAL